MADTTPIANQLSLDLARRLNDGIASTGDNGVDAATDGKIMFDDFRNKYVIVACRWVIDQLVLRLGIEAATPLLQGALTSQSITFSASGVSLNKDYLYPSRLLQSTTSTFKYITSRTDAVIDANPMDTKVYTVDNGKLYAWIRTAGVLTIQSSGTGTFYYIGSPRVNTSSGADVAVNTAPDIALDPKYFQAIVSYAQFLACMDKNTTFWLERAKTAFEEAKSYLPQ